LARLRHCKVTHRQIAPFSVPEDEPEYGFPYSIIIRFDRWFFYIFRKNYEPTKDVNILQAEFIELAILIRNQSRPFLLLSYIPCPT
jgi:hypothetical protein